MWNEVVLLASGLALGWTMVNYWSVADAELRGQRLRLLLAAAVGLGMVIWLSWRSFQAGISGLLVIGMTALIAYAANARQVNRLPFVLPPHQPHPPEGGAQAGSAVLLVTSAEPPTYNGPAYWSQVLQHLPGAPHWFVRPRAYARIRQAYGLMDGTHPLASILTELAEYVQLALPDAALVQIGYQGEQRALLGQTVALADQGFQRIVFVALEQEPAARDILRELVGRSGLEDTPMTLVYAQPLALSATSAAAQCERLRMLINGTAVTVPALNPDEIQTVIQAANAGLAQAETLQSIAF